MAELNPVEAVHAVRQYGSPETNYNIYKGATP